MAVIALWSHLTNPLLLPEDGIKLFGRSLGTAPTIQLATRVEARFHVRAPWTRAPGRPVDQMVFVPFVCIDSVMSVRTFCACSCCGYLLRLRSGGNELNK